MHIELINDYIGREVFEKFKLEEQTRNAFLEHMEEMKESYSSSAE